MLSGRKPTLEEWFLAYQMRAIWRNHAHTPIYVDADISEIVRRLEQRGQRPAYPALAIRALAETARLVPDINRCYLQTPLGDRVVEFDHISVNMPVALREGTGEHLMGLTVKNADQKSVDQIGLEIREARDTPLDKTLITKHTVRRPNTLLWRTLLRGVHFASYNLGAIGKLGGGLSVSSLIDHQRFEPVFRSVSFGPTAVTLFLSGVRRSGERTVLEMGMGFDHLALSGQVMRRAVSALHDLLSSRGDESLSWLE